MSWKIQSAVGRKSTHIVDGVGRLLYRLAEYANEDGVIDPAPNQETMAAWYGVSSRTVRNWVNTLIASGELVQLRIGKGPGQTSAYRILLNLTPEELSQSPKPENRKRIEESAAASLNERMSQIEETIKGFVSGINERLSAIENQLEEYRKKEETNAAFVSGIRDRLEALENLIPEKAERNTGNATRSNVQTIYNDLNNRKNTHPQTPSQNGNGKHGNGVYVVADEGDGEKSREDRLWGVALDLLGKWQRKTGIRRGLKVDNGGDKEDYFIPALTIADTFDGDGAAAWLAIEDEYHRMIGDGLNVKRLSAVVSGVAAAIHRANLPADYGKEPAFADPSWPKPNEGGRW